MTASWVVQKQHRDVLAAFGRLNLSQGRPRCQEIQTPRFRGANSADRVPALSPPRGAVMGSHLPVLLAVCLLAVSLFQAVSTDMSLGLVFLVAFFYFTPQA